MLVFDLTKLYCVTKDLIINWGIFFFFFFFFNIHHYWLKKFSNTELRYRIIHYVTNTLLFYRAVF